MDLTRVRFVRGWGLLLCAAALLAPGTHSYAATTSASALTAEKLLPDDTLVVVIPEFVPAKLWEKILHNHSGLMLKFALLSQRNVVVCNVRYFLEPFTGPVRIVRDHEPAAHEISPNGGPGQQHTPSSSGARVAK